MASIIYPDGSLQDIIPPSGRPTFTMMDMCLALSGPVAVFFISDLWVFSNRMGLQLNLPVNQRIYNDFRVTIHGPCIVCKISELPPQFFVPSEEDFQKAQMTIDRILLQRNRPPAHHSVEGSDDDLSDTRTVHFTPEVQAQVMEAAYENFMRAKDGKDAILKKLVLFNNAEIYIEIPPQKEHRLNTIDNIIQYFSDTEEYEKCMRLRELRVSMESIPENYE